MLPRRVRDGLAAAGVAGILSGAPSTLYAAVTGRSLWEASAAAGRLALPETASKGSLVRAGGAVHSVISAGWAIVLSYTLPRGKEVTGGAVAGLAIAALDLGLVGRRIDEIRTLPLVPQVADHVAFGAVAGWVISRRRARCPERHGRRG